MLLHCLGSGGYFPNDRRHTSCYYLPDWGVVLDAGTGMYRLRSFELPPRLDVLLSHCHLDHVFGLTTMLVVCHEHPDMEIHVWGQSEKVEAVRTQLLSEHLFPVPLPFQWHDVHPGQTIELPSVKITTRLQEHPGGSLAFSLADSSRKIVYATDTVGDAGADFVQWADQPDLLIHECYFAAEQSRLARQTGHTHTDQLAKVISAVQPRQVLVTHINPLAESDDQFDAVAMTDRHGIPVTIANDGLAVSVETLADPV